MVFTAGTIPTAATPARSQLLAAWQSGTALVSWAGHGGLDMISSYGVLTSYDAPSLSSTGRLPLMVAMTCTINRFENGFLDPLAVALTFMRAALTPSPRVDLPEMTTAAPGPSNGNE